MPTLELRNWRILPALLLEKGLAEPPAPGLLQNNRLKQHALDLVTAFL
jgi:hypothetical protein